jgi:hypothetical protein
VEERFEIAGADHLQLANGVRHLRPEVAVFTAMLAGLAGQQSGRLLSVVTIAQRKAIVRRFALLMSYLVDRRYRWGEECQAADGAPMPPTDQQPCHEPGLPSVRTSTLRWSWVASWPRPAGQSSHRQPVASCERPASVIFGDHPPPDPVPPLPEVLGHRARVIHDRIEDTRECKHRILINIPTNRLSHNATLAGLAREDAGNHASRRQIPASTAAQPIAAHRHCAPHFARQPYRAGQDDIYISAQVSCFTNGITPPLRDHPLSRSGDRARNGHERRLPGAACATHRHWRSPRGSGMAYHQPRPAANAPDRPMRNSFRRSRFPCPFSGRLRGCLTTSLGHSPTVAAPTAKRNPPAGVLRDPHPGIPTANEPQDARESRIRMPT